MELVAIDLEGSGAQDRDHEAILEIALVPIVDWQPDMTAAYCTLINPQRSIPPRPWISPGLTDEALRQAPTIATAEPELARRINGKYLVGHNVSVDWRLLRRRCPSVTPAGLLDTFRLARVAGAAGGRGLSRLIDHFRLTETVNDLAGGSMPHRALWDAVAAAMLLLALAPPSADTTPNIQLLMRDSEVMAFTVKPEPVPPATLFD